MPPLVPSAAVPESAQESPFDAVVFAGGGCRCFWQAGFYGVVAPALGLKPKVVSVASAGAAFACASLLGRQESVLEDFKRRAELNQRNWYPGNWVRGKTIFPHEQIYRNTIQSGISDSDFKRLQEGPELRIILARPPTWAVGRVGFALAAFAYTLDQSQTLSRMRWAERFGFFPEIVSLQQCSTIDALVDLILHSSCTPPLLPLYRRGGRVVIDGGLIDNAPADFVGPARSTLVMLSRHHRPDELPTHPDRVYVAPSKTIPIEKWDYTSPGLVDQTYDLGRRDGEAFVASARGQVESSGLNRRGYSEAMPTAG